MVPYVVQFAPYAIDIILRKYLRMFPGNIEFKIL